MPIARYDNPAKTENHAVFLYTSPHALIINYAGTSSFFLTENTSSPLATTLSPT